MRSGRKGENAALAAGQPPLDLIVTLDDATSEISSAFLVEEGKASSFRGLAETIARKGLFCSLYTDRGSHYFHTPKAGERVDKTRPTQVGRAFAEFGIEHIPSYSPEARGRMERVFGEGLLEKVGHGLYRATGKADSRLNRQS